ncbi:MAG: DUF924 family protein [Burkholderiaceae bacterium]
MNDATTTPIDAQAVLDHWFAPVGDAQHGTLRNLWFRKDPATDAEIVQRFGVLVEQALRGDLNHWARVAEGGLARILLLDQFTRNAFRDTPRAFAGDALALEAAIAMVATRQDEVLLPVQRAFVYLPFEHAEAIAMQDEAVRLFTRLTADAPALQGMLDYAERHRVVIRRFGRFPHRNAILGRPSTAVETAFLREPGSSF